MIEGISGTRCSLPEQLARAAIPAPGSEDRRGQVADPGEAGEGRGSGAAQTASSRHSRQTSAVRSGGVHPVRLRAGGCEHGGVLRDLCHLTSGHVVGPLHQARLVEDLAGLARRSSPRCRGRAPRRPRRLLRAERPTRQAIVAALTARSRRRMRGADRHDQALAQQQTQGDARPGRRSIPSRGICLRRTRGRRGRSPSFDLRGLLHADAHREAGPRAGSACCFVTPRSPRPLLGAATELHLEAAAGEQDSEAVRRAAAPITAALRARQAADDSHCSSITARSGRRPSRLRAGRSSPCGEGERPAGRPRPCAAGSVRCGTSRFRGPRRQHCGGPVPGPDGEAALGAGRASALDPGPSGKMQIGPPARAPRAI